MGETQFPVVRRGYEPRAVDAVIEDLRDRVAHAEATTHAARSYAASLLSELHRLQALEDELTTALDLARQTGEAIVADARERAAELVGTAEHQASARLVVAELEASERIADSHRRAEETLAAGRARLAAETAEMEKYRLAIAAEATMLQQIEQRLAPHLSRAAARLVEVVDAPDGIGPFSRATANLVQLARLAQRAVAAGAYEDLELDVDGEGATLRLRTRALDLRDGEPMVPIDVRHDPVPATQPAVPRPHDQTNALNISSMALS